MKGIKVITILITSISLSSANAAVLANLFNDYTGTDFTGATVNTTTFTTNNWSFFHGFGGVTELTFKSGTLGTDGGTGFGDATGTGGFGQTALVSADGVFDGASPNPVNSELTFHPSNVAGAAASDLIIRWTANQNYSDGISIEHALRTPTGSNVGYALALNGTLLGNVATNWGAAGTTGTTTESTSAAFASLGNISNGDTVDIIVFRNGNFSGDQTFGNFVINSVPEPSSLLLFSLASLGLVIRRRS